MFSPAPVLMRGIDWHPFLVEGLPQRLFPVYGILFFLGDHAKAPFSVQLCRGEDKFFFGQKLKLRLGEGRRKVFSRSVMRHEVPTEPRCLVSQPVLTSLESCLPIPACCSSLPSALTLETLTMASPSSASSQVLRPPRWATSCRRHNSR